MTDQYVGGGNAELLMLVVGSLATLLPQSSSSVDIKAWAECMKGIGKSVAGKHHDEEQLLNVRMDPMSTMTFKLFKSNYSRIYVILMIS